MYIASASETEIGYVKEVKMVSTDDYTLEEPKRSPHKISKPPLPRWRYA
jgi:hypothetical protein